MQILLIGASGRTGQLVLSTALAKGHTVTALVRDPKKMEERNGLTVVEGTPLDVSDIERAFKATETPPEAAIVTLSSIRAGDSPFAAQVSPPRLMADSNANLTSVLKTHGVKKMVIMQAVGIGKSWSTFPLMLRVLMSQSNMRHAYADHNLVDEETRKSGITFVMVRPTRLLETEEASKLRVLGEDGKGQGLMSSTSRGSVAAFLVEAAEKDEWDGTAPVITN